jgi:glycosyltransferase involved in cell wall biosynthesis
MLPPINNGVPIPPLRPHAKCDFALMLARICPEKGIHIGIDAAKRAGVPLLICGELYGYPAHRAYFEEQVMPRLDRLRRFIGPVGGARKQRLLAAARCLLAPSLIKETSSLVAREALAAGAPVIAFRSGALTEAVDDGRTGFLVDDVPAMARAIGRATALSSGDCRRFAEARFSLESMIDGYFSAYRTILLRSGGAKPLAGAA